MRLAALAHDQVLAVAAWVAQEAPTPTGTQVVDWVLAGGAPALLAYGWWSERSERRDIQVKDADRQERLIPVLTEFTGVLREIKQSLEASQARSLPTSEAIDKLGTQLDELRAELRSGGRHGQSGR